MGKVLLGILAFIGILIFGIIIGNIFGIVPVIIGIIILGIVLMIRVSANNSNRSEKAHEEKTHEEKMDSNPYRGLKVESMVTPYVYRFCDCGSKSEKIRGKEQCSVCWDPICDTCRKPLDNECRSIYADTCITCAKTEFERKRNEVFYNHPEIHKISNILNDYEDRAVLYALELEGDNVFVGSARSAYSPYLLSMKDRYKHSARRMKIVGEGPEWTNDMVEHFSGGGHDWTVLHKPVNLMFVYLLPEDYKDFFIPLDEAYEEYKNAVDENRKPESIVTVGDVTIDIKSYRDIRDTVEDVKNSYNWEEVAYEDALAFALNKVDDGYTALSSSFGRLDENGALCKYPPSEHYFRFENEPAIHNTILSKILNSTDLLELI